MFAITPLCADSDGGLEVPVNPLAMHYLAGGVLLSSLVSSYLAVQRRIKESSGGKKDDEGNWLIRFAVSICGAVSWVLVSCQVASRRVRRTRPPLSPKPALLVHKDDGCMDNVTKRDVHTGIIVPRTTIADIEGGRSCRL